MGMLMLSSEHLCTSPETTSMKLPKCLVTLPEQPEDNLHHAEDAHASEQAKGPT